MSTLLFKSMATLLIVWVGCIMLAVFKVPLFEKHLKSISTIFGTIIIAGFIALIWIPT